MRPFAEAGAVDVFPASTCVRVVASGGCAATIPPVDEPVPALDPEEACQHAIDAASSYTGRIRSTARRRSPR
jgi:hypothetical protein